MVRPTITLFFAAVLSAAASFTYPQEVYLGVAANRTQTQAATGLPSSENFGGPVNTQGSGEEKTSKAASFVAGYRGGQCERLEFHPCAAFEIGYTDFGQVHSQRTAIRQSIVYAEDARSWEVASVHAAVIGHLHVRDGFSLVGKAGLHFMKTWFAQTSLISVGAGAGSVTRHGAPVIHSGRGTSPAIGFGAAYRVGRFEARAMFEHIWPDASMFGSEANKLDRMESASLGLFVHF